MGSKWRPATEQDGDILDSFGDDGTDDDLGVRNLIGVCPRVEHPRRFWAFTTGRDRAKLRRRSK